MRATTFLRIARAPRGGFKITAHTKRPNEPHRNQADGRALATFVVCLFLELPDDAFTVPTAQATIEAQHLTVVVEPEPA